MDWELEMCDGMARDFLKKKYGIFWKMKCKDGELSDKTYEFYKKFQKEKGIVHPKIKEIKNLKERKLLGKAWIKCPDSHEDFSNVYEDNGLRYYICSVCGTVVGLPVYGKLKDGGFTGHNCNEIINIFKVRETRQESKK